MAARRLSMRKIKEVLRLKANGKSFREIANSCNIGHSTAREYVLRAKSVGLSWPLPADLDDVCLEALLYPETELISGRRAMLPDMQYIHRELKRKGVTLHLLWYEYKESHPNGYQYSQFCLLYRQWAQRLHACLRQPYRAGEKLFVDYAGQTVPIVEPTTGELKEAQIFVAVLGASNYTFAKATASQSLPCWIKAHVDALQFFGGVAQILVPDNTKVAITNPCRYEPDINPTYLDFAQHYGLTVIPARVAKPRDKAKVEAGVLLAERWILAALRNRTFFSMAELNGAIAEKLTILNNRQFKKLNTTRKELFETIERPALKPLPSQPYAFAEWKKATVNIDYHIELDGHYYSVPYQLIKHQLDVRLSAHTVEVLFKNHRIVSHLRSYTRGHYTTLPEHRPKSHQRYLQWTPGRIIRWAAKTGPYTEELVTKILHSRPHPEQGFRSCLGIIRLGKRYSPQRLEAACLRALKIHALSYKNVASILKKGLDQQPLGPQPKAKVIVHPNVRGTQYYRR
jgi:transposase